MIGFTHINNEPLQMAFQQEQANQFTMQFEKLVTYSKKQRHQIIEEILRQEPSRQQQLKALFNGLAWLKKRDECIEHLELQRKAISMSPKSIVLSTSEHYDELTDLLMFCSNIDCPQEVLQTSLYEELSPRAYMFFIPSLLLACLQAEQQPTPFFSLAIQRLCTLDAFHIERFAYCFDRTLIYDFLDLYEQNPYFIHYHEQIRHSLSHYWA